MAGLVLNTRYFELTTMKETIFDSLPVIGKSLAEIKPSDKYREKCPAGSALAMSIAQNAVQLKKQNKLLTVICADPSDVIRLQDEVTWFVPSLKLTVFPDWETLPYDVLSPHADLVGDERQVAVVAYQLGDAFTNFIVPTSGCLLGALAAAKLDWGKWAKFQIKFQAVLFAFGSIAVILAVVIGLS